MSTKLYTYAAIGAGLAGFYAYDQYDKAANYVEAKGTVKNVEQSCYLEDSKYTTDVISCERAEALKLVHPKYKTWRLKRDVQVTVAFRSPVDDKFHTSALKIRWSEGDKVPRTGDAMKILASSTEPSKARTY